VSVLTTAVSQLRSSSRRRLLWRSLLAAPFVLSLVLALLMGPATVDNPHASFAWLVAWSLLAALGMLLLPEGLLVLLALATLVAFPLLAGLGFHFVPGWAAPIVAVVFYGSIAASLAGVASGMAAVLRPLVRTHPRAAAIAAGGSAFLALGTIVAMQAAPSSAVSPVAASVPTLRNLGPVINTAQREAEPTFSADGRTMVFNCRDYEICVSHTNGTWDEGTWTTPELLGAPISTDYLEVEPWLGPAGDKLYFNSNRPFARGDSLPGLALYVNVVGRVGGELGITPLGGVGQDEIWVSYLTDGRWSEPRNLNEVPGEPRVNTEFMDHCLAFSADGNEVFWTSTRPGGLGGNDIWTSRRAGGAWTQPENLGPAVNSPTSEHHSIPSPDGRSLHVTSDRAGGYGGDDMYAATRGADGAWAELVNLGPKLNGPGSDRCAAWTPDGTVFLFDSDRPGGFGSKDLWWVHFQDVALATARGSP
jgi:WD40-like Beta Propeller Repeat